MPSASEWDAGVEPVLTTLLPAGLPPTRRHIQGRGYPAPWRAAVFWAYHFW